MLMSWTPTAKIDHCVCMRVFPIVFKQKWPSCCQGLFHCETVNRPVAAKSILLVEWLYWNSSKWTFISCSSLKWTFPAYGILVRPQVDPSIIVHCSPHKSENRNLINIGDERSGVKAFANYRDLLRALSTLYCLIKHYLLITPCLHGKWCLKMFIWINYPGSGLIHWGTL